MPACDSQSLATSAAPLQAIPAGLQMAVLIQLFCSLAGMNCDAQSLVNSVPCLLCNLPPGTQMAILISLACQIATNGSTGGGGGGGAQLVAYTVAPPAAPANVAANAIAYDPNGLLPTLGWRTSDQTWN